MPNISSLYTSLSALQAQRKVMDVTSHNVANASTPGYHRQRVELKSLGAQPVAGIMSGPGNRPYGVGVLGVTRSADSLLEARVVREEGGRAQANLTNSTMARIEGIFPEPTDVGLANQFDEFWGAWTAVATNPENLASRTQLLQTAETLASSLNRASIDLTSVKDIAVDRVAGLAVEVNDLAAQIALLNETIVGNPGASLDLIDQRDLLVTSIAKLTGANAVPSTGGQVDVYINGRAIVSGTRAFTLESAAGTDAGPPPVAFAGRLQFTDGDYPVNAVSGEAAALAATINKIVPDYLAALDDVASTLAQQVNAVHTLGYDQTSTIGGNFFKPAVAPIVGPPAVAGIPVTAANIALDANVVGQPSRIAAGAPTGGVPPFPGVLDGGQARAIALLADSATGPDSKYHALIADLAVMTQAASRRADIQNQVADTTQSEADSVGAVSIDEEMANLVGAQRAFEASARVLTVVDDMIAFLIERTGMVGR